MQLIAMKLTYALTISISLSGENLEFYHDFFSTQKIVKLLFEMTSIQKQRNGPQRVPLTVDATVSLNRVIHAHEISTEQKHRQTKCDPKKIKGKEITNMPLKKNETSLSFALCPLVCCCFVFFGRFMSV